MPSIGAHKNISDALQGDSVLAQDVASTIAAHPETGSVFHRVIQFFTDKEEDAEEQRPAKRIKVEDGSAVSSKHLDQSSGDSKPVPTSDETSSGGGGGVVLAVHELSFVTPIRKKLSLIVSQNSLAAVHPSNSTKAEMEIPFQDIINIAVLPVPEKAAKMYNFCIFKKSADDALVFTVPDTPPKTAVGQAIPGGEESVTSSYKNLISHVLNKTIRHLHVMEPDARDFTSALPQPHRKNEPAVHVTAHRGSKEGYLYFLSNGIVYGFKRPLLFIPLEDIASVTYNDILQRTFNLTVATNQRDENLEFSMIDIVEHDRVDQYVRKYQLNDASLSESRKAKVVNAKNVALDSEITKAANEIAASVSGGHTESTNADIDDDQDDDEEDEEFRDDEGHSGSTLASDETDAEASDEEEAEGGGSNDEESDA